MSSQQFVFMFQCRIQCLVLRSNRSVSNTIVSVLREVFPECVVFQIATGTGNAKKRKEISDYSQFHHINIDNIESGEVKKSSFHDSTVEANSIRTSITENCAQNIQSNRTWAIQNGKLANLAMNWQNSGIKHAIWLDTIVSGTVHRASCVYSLNENILVNAITIWATRPSSSRSFIYVQLDVPKSVCLSDVIDYLKSSRNARYCCYVDIVYLDKMINEPNSIVEQYLQRTKMRQIKT